MDTKGKSKFGKGLGQLLRTLRKQHGLTQIELASKLSINYRHYQDIEAGRTDVRIGTVNHIVSLYNVDLIQLLEAATKPDLWKHSVGGVNAAPVGFAETNRDGIIIFANKTHHKQLGYEFPKMVGRSLFDMVTNSHRSDMQQWYRAIFDNQTEPKLKQILMRHREGDDIFLNMVWNYVRGGESTLTGISAVFYDPRSFS